MLKKYISLCIILSMIPFSGFSVLASNDAVDVTVKVSPSQASIFNNGEFEGWGTSLCWWANYLGQYDELAQKSAKLMFNPEEGLGLNIARYNIGGGDDPTHDHITRPDSNMPGFINSDGTYDWTADENQRLVLKYAMQEGVDIVEAFSNSPPYFMTNSGCATGAVNAWENNLRDDQYEEFADYLAEVTKHFKDEWGITFNSLEPMNEPASNTWGAFSFKQEGCHFSQGESQSKIITELAKAMKEKGLTDTIISASDETSIDMAISGYNNYSDEAKKMVSRINTHSYDGSQRAELKALAKANGKELWMSEVDGGNTSGVNAGQMGPGLWLGQKITDDLNGMQPSAWVLWQVIDRHISNETPDTSAPSDGGYWGTAIANHFTKEVQLTKKYYAFGQYTKFIRPGYTIVASGDNTVAAYDKNNGRIVIVALNANAYNRTYKFDLSDFANVGNKVRVIRTSGDLANGENWAKLNDIETSGKAFSASLLANSITTFVVEPDLEKHKLTFTNENGSKLSADSIEYTQDNSVIIKNSQNNTVLKKDLTFGEYSEGDVWTLNNFEDYCYITNADGIRLVADENGILALKTETSGNNEKWAINPELNILYMNLKNNSSFIYTNSDVQMEIESTPALLDNSNINWTVTEPDGSVTDKATISSNGLLSALKSGRVKVTAAAKYDQTLFTTIELIIYDRTDYITFANKNSKLLLDVSNHSIAEGSPTVQYENMDFSSSQWRMQAADNTGRCFNIVNRKSNMLLANSGGATVITSNVPETDESSQWLVEEVTPGYYKIINKATQMGLNVSQQSKDNGAIVIQYPFSGADNELWSIKKVEKEPIDISHTLTKISIDKSMVTGTAPWNNGADTAQNTADGNYGTFFDGLTQGWVQIDLGKMFDIAAIGYVPRAGYEFRMKDGAFFGSADGANWTKLYTVKEIPPYTLNLVIQNNFDAQDSKFRYIKYLVPEGTHNYAQDGRTEEYCCNIAEIELYGSEVKGVIGKGIDVYNGSQKLEMIPNDGGRYNIKTAYANSSEESISLYYIVMVKSDNKLIDVKVVPKTFAANEEYTFDNVLEVPSVADSPKLEIKAMLWDNIDNYVPYALPLSINR